ncbi:MAG TPA: hypothetical protein VJ729_05980 [Nitrososphaeraceae archaeon]|nr:hypothetical protein [Nitrososphaeraceae archaeon]
MENMPQERLQAYKTIRMENLPGFFLVWRGSLTNITSAMSSNANNTASKKNLPIATFNAVFSMVMLNCTDRNDNSFNTYYNLIIDAGNIYLDTMILAGHFWVPQFINSDVISW